MCIDIEINIDINVFNLDSNLNFKMMNKYTGLIINTKHKSDKFMMCETNRTLLKVQVINE